MAFGEQIWKSPEGSGMEVPVILAFPTSSISSCAMGTSWSTGLVSGGKVPDLGNGSMVPSSMPCTSHLPENKTMAWAELGQGLMQEAQVDINLMRWEQSNATFPGCAKAFRHNPQICGMQMLMGAWGHPWMNPLGPRT